MLPALICDTFITTGSDEGGWNVARVCGRDNAEGAVAAAFIARNFSGKKVAVIDDKSASGKGLADVTSKGLEAAGFPIALSEPFTAGEKDYTLALRPSK
jgi:branched-chain amino acid transport system substrate-binding protein